MWPNVKCYELQKRPVVALPVRQKKETKPEKSQAIMKHQTRMNMKKQAGAELGQAQHSLS